jgi:hypothetical protein
MENLENAGIFEEVLRTQRKTRELNDGIERWVAVFMTVLFAVLWIPTYAWLWSVIVHTMAVWFLSDIPQLSWIATLSKVELFGMMMVLRLLYKPGVDKYEYDRAAKRTAKESFVSMAAEAVGNVIGMLSVWGVAWIVQWFFY